MSEANVELVRRGFEAALQRPKPDFATMNEVFHADHEFISLFAVLEGGSHRGASGYREWLTNTEAAIPSEVRLEKVAEIDKDRVLVIMSGRVSGKSSGVKLDEQTIAAVVTVGDGKIIRSESYRSPEQALKAAGLAE